MDGKGKVLLISLGIAAVAIAANSKRSRRGGIRGLGSPPEVHAKRSKVEAGMAADFAVSVKKDLSKGKRKLALRHFAVFNESVGGVLRERASMGGESKRWGNQQDALWRKGNQLEKAIIGQCFVG